MASSGISDVFWGKLTAAFENYANKIGQRDPIYRLENQRNKKLRDAKTFHKPETNGGAGCFCVCVSTCAVFDNTHPYNPLTPPEILIVA